MNKWKLYKTLPREVILAIVFMKRIHRRGLDFLGGPKKNRKTTVGVFF